MFKLIESNGDEFLIENYSIQQLKDMLANDTVVVTFVKKSNGRKRIMYCTRDPDRIPARHHPSGAGLPYDDPNVIPVFDLVKKAWRSFRVELVKNAEVRRVSYLARLLRRRKYTQDTRESYEMDGLHILALGIKENSEILSLKEFQEMAAGRVGGGAETVVNPTVWRQRATSVVARVNITMNGGKKLKKLPSPIENINFYIIRDGWSGHVVGTKSNDPAELAIEDIDQIVFVCDLFEEGDQVPHFENGMETYVIRDPYVNPTLAKQGIGQGAYRAIGAEVNIIADNIQSKQGRLLWNSLVKRNVFPHVYVYDSNTDEIEADVAGNEQNFQYWMNQESARFIATVKKI